jgi:DNA-binding MarR family transcriptional regulator
VPPENEVGYLVKRVQQALRTTLDTSLASRDLTTAQYAVLYHLAHSPDASNAELARLSFVTPQTMIRLVRGLERKRFLVRRPSPRDPHVLEARLTPQGQSLLRTVQRQVDSIHARMLGNLSRSDSEQLATWLTYLAERLEGHRPLVARSAGTSSKLARVRPRIPAQSAVARGSPGAPRVNPEAPLRTRRRHAEPDVA